MYLLSGLILGLVLSAVSADIECFKDKVTACQRKYHKQNGGKQDVGRQQVNAYKCVKDSAFQCKTGFEEEAMRVFLAIVDTCIKGYRGYGVLQRDPNCGFEIFNDVGQCGDESKKELEIIGTTDYVAIHKVLCKHADAMVDCMYKNLENKCRYETLTVFKIVSKVLIKLQKKICSVLPAGY